MPSVLLGTQSGGYAILSGFFSGIVPPVGGVQFLNDRASSGSAYLAFGLPLLSGGITIQSGGGFGISGGLRDGIQIPPAVSFFVPNAVIQNQNTALTGGQFSGTYNLWAATDAASGFCRVYWMVM